MKLFQICKEGYICNLFYLKTILGLNFNPKENLLIIFRKTNLFDKIVLLEFFPYNVLHRKKLRD